jgi:hypothetical protein
VSAPIALFEIHENGKKERREMAEQVYRQADDRYMDFIKICIEHPRLDCYSASFAPSLDPPLTPDEQMQQKLLYTALTEVLEAAYIEYHKAGIPGDLKPVLNKQWPGWELYMKRFLARRAYTSVWKDIEDEYANDFRRCMDTLSSTPSSDRVTRCPLMER